MVATGPLCAVLAGLLLATVYSEANILPLCCADAMQNHILMQVHTVGGPIMDIWRGLLHFH